MGTEKIPVYSCPVALAKQKWIERIFAINRNEKYPELLKHLIPKNPSSALLEAIDYCRSEVSKLHAEQQRRERERQ